MKVRRSIHLSPIFLAGHFREAWKSVCPPFSPSVEAFTKASMPASQNTKPNADNVIPFRRPKPARNRPAAGGNSPEHGSARGPGRWPPTTVAFVVCVLIFLCLKAFSPWPVGLTLRHWVAGTGCDAARLVGLSPAHIGDAGYWHHLDPGRTGVSCKAP